MTDEEIFADFKRGKLEALYHTLYRPLLVYASRCLGDDASFMAEDCVQDGIYRTYELRHTLHSPLVFKSYLYASVHNRAISILRKQRSEENYLSSHEEEEEDFQLNFIEQETLSLLFEAIDNLPPRLRRLFDLSFEQGLKNTEVAAILNVSGSAVKKQKAALIAHLRDDLKKKTGGDFMNMMLFILLH